MGFYGRGVYVDDGGEERECLKGWVMGDGKEWGWYGRGTVTYSLPSSSLYHPLLKPTPLHPSPQLSPPPPILTSPSLPYNHHSLHLSLSPVKPHPIFLPSPPTPLLISPSLPPISPYLLNSHPIYSPLPPNPPKLSPLSQSPSHY